MKKLIVACLLVLGIVGGVQADEAANEKRKAPAWELYDAANKLTTSADFTGKPHIIHFWATWCPYCKKVQPGLDRLYTQYAEQGLEMIAISFWEDEGAQPQRVLDERGHSFKTLINGDQVARELFGVQGTPTTFFIDKDGYVLGMTRISDPDDPRLEKAVQMLLAK